MAGARSNKGAGMIARELRAKQAEGLKGKQSNKSYKSVCRSYRQQFDPTRNGAEQRFDRQSAAQVVLGPSSPSLRPDAKVVLAG